MGDGMVGSDLDFLIGDRAAMPTWGEARSLVESSAARADFQGIEI
jgi:hypothetical protein